MYLNSWQSTKEDSNLFLKLRWWRLVDLFMARYIVSYRFRTLCDATDATHPLWALITLGPKHMGFVVFLFACFFFLSPLWLYIQITLNRSFPYSDRNSQCILWLDVSLKIGTLKQIVWIFSFFETIFLQTVSENSFIFLLLASISVLMQLHYQYWYLSIFVGSTMYSFPTCLEFPSCLSHSYSKERIIFRKGIPFLTSKKWWLTSVHAILF